MNVIYILLGKLDLREFDSFAKDHPGRMTYTVPFKVFVFGAGRNLDNLNFINRNLIILEKSSKTLNSKRIMYFGRY